MYLNSGNSELIRCLDAQGEPRWAASSGAAAELHPPGRGQAEIRATHMGHSGRGGGRRRGLRGGAGRGGARRGGAGRGGCGHTVRGGSGPAALLEAVHLNGERGEEEGRVALEERLPWRGLSK